MTLALALAPPAPVLRVEGLVKRFGALTAVDGLSLQVRPGEVFGLLGPNGAGKTTTIRLICGELPADGGQVLLHGRALAATADGRARVGLCPQEIVVWRRLTCTEQLEFVGRLYGLSRRAARDRVRVLLDQLGLAAQSAVLAETLSGGMQRRLNIALALVHSPELVILDEPGAGLDPASRVLVREFVRSLARDATVVITTHELDEAERLCDRVAIVDAGRLLACDTPDALRATLGYRAVLEARLEEPGDRSATGAGAADRQRVVALVARAAGVAPDDVMVTGDRVAVRCEEPTDSLPAVLAALAAAGRPAAEVRVRPTCLEDVFLHLTGRQVRP